MKNVLLFFFKNYILQVVFKCKYQLTNSLATVQNYLRHVTGFFTFNDCFGYEFPLRYRVG